SGRRGRLAEEKMHTEVDGRPMGWGRSAGSRGHLDPAGLIEIPAHGSHLGQRSSDRTAKAGHMTASDLPLPMQKLLAKRGPSTHDPGISRSCTLMAGSSPAMTV